MPFRKRLLVTGSIFLIVALPGCTEAGDDRFTVVMDAMHFSPASLEVPRGATVVWHNRSPYTHSVSTDAAGSANPSHAVVPPGSSGWSSGDLTEGEVFTVTLDTPGRYVYFCRYHGAQEMIGTITVTD